MRNQSILIVSDSANFRRGLQNLLLLDGHRVQTARDGIEALDIVGSRHLDLVATDLSLPNMDGIELIANVKDLQRDVPIIVFSERCPEWEQAALRKMGVFQHVVDPVSPEKAKGLIEKALFDRIVYHGGDNGIGH